MSLDDRIEEMTHAAIGERVFPGCVVGYLRDDNVTVLPFGHLTYETGSAAVTDRTIYDVASITKSIPTSSIILKLIEDGRLSLDDKAVNFLPELTNEYREKILIRHLLTFTVTFRLSDTMANLAKQSPVRLLQTIFAAPLEAPPGQKYIYTNAPSLLLGLIAERICRKPLDDIAHDMFFEPLHMTRTTFHARPVQAREIAPTAVDWRGEVRGLVHDPSAGALYQLGHVPGHAGLFSTAPDLLKFADMLIHGGKTGGHRFFDKKTIAGMHTIQIQAADESAGLGWTMRRPQVMGTAGSAQMFGKTGFTGTMILIDPVKKMALVVLSNRTYPETPESYEPMRAFWRGMADLVFAD